MSGHYEDLARHYAVPMDMDLAGHSISITSREDVVLQLHRCRLALAERGICKLDPQIIALELPNVTQRVWVRWHALDANGAELATAETVYVMDKTHGGLRAKSMQHTSLLVPEFAQPHYRNRLIRSRA
ncbi:MAG: hypothetical protein ACOH2H_14905 [Cypionkella sp.]